MNENEITKRVSVGKDEKPGAHTYADIREKEQAEVSEEVTQELSSKQTKKSVSGRRDRASVSVLLKGRSQ